jgi:hypothetical protein
MSTAGRLVVPFRNIVIGSRRGIRLKLEGNTLTLVTIRVGWPQGDRALSSSCFAGEATCGGQ